MATFHVIFPAGDRTRLNVLELDDRRQHEIRDYALASRRTFPDRVAADSCAKDLANLHGIRFVEEVDGREQSFLD